MSGKNKKRKYTERRRSKRISNQMKEGMQAKERLRMGLADDEIERGEQGSDKFEICMNEYDTQVLKCAFKLHKTFGDRVLYCFSHFPEVAPGTDLSQTSDKELEQQVLPTKPETDESNQTLITMNAYSDLFYSDCSDCNRIEMELSNLRTLLQQKEEELSDRDSILAGLLQEKRENILLIHTLQTENKRLDQLSFNKDEKLKILQDRVNQLQDTNAYRERIVVLEAEKEEEDMRMRRLQEEHASMKEKYNSERKILTDKVNTLEAEKEEEKMKMRKAQEEGGSMKEKYNSEQKILTEKVNTLQADNEFLRTENKKVKNEILVWKQQSESILIADGDDSSDEEIETCEDILMKLKVDFEDFKQFMCTFVSEAISGTEHSPEQQPPQQQVQEYPQQQQQHKLQKKSMPVTATGTGTTTKTAEKNGY